MVYLETVPWHSSEENLETFWSEWSVAPPKCYADISRIYVILFACGCDTWFLRQKYANYKCCETK
jgi:hypothetical protein